MKHTDVVILAAGKGSRMQSDLPKVLHPLGGRPMLEHVLVAAGTVPDGRSIVVTGHGATQVEQSFADGEHLFARQGEQLGTAHAVQMALPHLRSGAVALILYADVPLINATTIARMLDAVSPQQIALLTLQTDNASGYGRIVRGAEGAIESIVEHRDANAEQLNINEINTGVMALGADQLKAWLPQINNNNAQGEYYLTDLIAIARANDCRVESIQPTFANEVQGVNNRVQLAELERAYQGQLARTLMLAGTTLADPARFDQRGELVAGVDNYIDINCVFSGSVTIGSGVTIGANCTISDSTIADGVEIKANSMIESAVLGECCSVGPFARLRPGTVLGKHAKVGNFVETKKAHVGEGSKINHLSYIGDAELGDHVNVGAGTITCNYDGANKHLTQIGDEVFIGSSSTLIAPVKIGDGGFVAAGTTLTKNVSDAELAVGRAKQRNIAGWQRPIKKED